MNKKLQQELTILSNQEPDNFAHQLRTDYNTALHIQTLIVNNLTETEVWKRKLEKEFRKKLNALEADYEKYVQFRQEVQAAVDENEISKAKGALLTAASIIRWDEKAELVEIKLKEQHDDECDCITCQARTEPGGLDHDPSSDDEEFEEHERQVVRDTGIDKEKK